VPDTIERAAFGLPLPFYFRSLGGKKTTITPIKRETQENDYAHRDGPRDKKKQGPDRMASPLLFRVFAFGSSNKRRFGVALINLAGKRTASPLQGFNLSMSLRSRDRRAPSSLTVNAPSALLIDEFIKWATSQAPAATQPRPRRRR
jgi:hypothetical protein